MSKSGIVVWVSIILCSLLLITGCAPKDPYTPPPGVVITYHAPSSGLYVASPSIAILPDGSYVACHDFYGPNSKEVNDSKTRIFKSTNMGKSWKQISKLKNQYYSDLFVHKGVLYLLGVTSPNSNITIRRSDDGGVTWTEPVDNKTGLIVTEGHYQCGAMPITEHNGRLYRAFEDTERGKDWGECFISFTISAPVDADLLDAASWTESEHIPWNEEWPGGGFLEGNVLTTPDGNLVNVLRHDSKNGGTAAIIHIQPDGKSEFNPPDDIIEFPGGCKKFTIRFDPESGYYWSLTNWIQEKYRNSNPERTRNTQALIRSKDLKNWEIRAVILEHPTFKITGFQYADWQFDGKDIIFVSRTAWDDGKETPPGCHDANYITFHRIKNFRKRVDKLTN